MYEKRHFRQLYDVFVHKLYYDVVYFCILSIVPEPCIYQNWNISGNEGGGDILKILFEFFFYLQAVPKNFLVSYSTWTH